MPLKRSEIHAVIYALLVMGAGQAAPHRALAQTPENASQVATRALDHAIIIDTHADTPQAMLEEGYDLASPATANMISIPKMRAGHLGAEFFSIWVDVAWPKQDLI